MSQPERQVIEVGDTVLCDWCNEDYTTSKEAGGFVFCSNATCPKCAPRMLKSIRRHHEEHFINARPRKGESFGDFIRRYRGPNATITIESWPNKTK